MQYIQRRTKELFNCITLEEKILRRGSKSFFYTRQLFFPFSDISYAWLQVNTEMHPTANVFNNKFRIWNLLWSGWLYLTIGIICF